MAKISIRKEKVFGKPAFVVLKNGEPLEFRFTKAGAENFAKKLRKRKK